MKKKLIEILLLIIITVPSFIVLFNGSYFSMHDDQHIARLFLLDLGIRQGYWFPRWVDMLGFGYGYPLFNFYPPLIYYISEFFHSIGFSFIAAIKLMIIMGFLAGSIGLYYFIKSFLNKYSAFVGVALYTFFFYHSVTVYVRGALAEFFSITILVYVFWLLYRFSKVPNITNSLLFSLSVSLLILTHPLIAFPSLIFIFFFFIYTFLLSENINRKKYLSLFMFGFILALGISAFFWLPSLVEKQYTLVDNILTKELANYSLYYIYPEQFWYSPWGYGGAAPGLADGMTYQLGKVHILLLILSIVLAVFVFLEKKVSADRLKEYFLFILLLLLSLFLSTHYSSFLWDSVKYLTYIQFPWRMLSFANIFLAISGSYSIYFLMKIGGEQKYKKIFYFIITTFTVFIIIVKYYPYFRPQNLIKTTDKVKTSYKEIAWRVSSTSYEFVPKQVQTKKTKQGTTTLAIEENEIPLTSYEIVSGEANVKIQKNNFEDKKFIVEASTPIIFRLNTYSFNGWKAYVNDKKISIRDDNRLHLIEVDLEKGTQTVEFKFEKTQSVIIGELLSLGSVVVFIYLIIRRIRSSLS